MKEKYTIVGLTETTMPNLVIQGLDEMKYRFDPFVSCSIKLDIFKNNLSKITDYCKTLIGREVIVDLEECGFDNANYTYKYGDCFYPYNRKQFTLKRTASQKEDFNLW